eukprot:scaffold1727_cov119-Isochrysis_galbana.AAC.10
MTAVLADAAGGAARALGTRMARGDTRCPLTDATLDKIDRRSSHVSRVQVAPCIPGAVAVLNRALWRRFIFAP